MRAARAKSQFKDIAYKDLNPKFEPAEEVSPHFSMQRISDFYYGWCAAAADINHDGVLDIISGPFYYLGPDYTERREFTAGANLQSQQPVFAGHGQLRLRFHGRRLAGYSDGRSAADLPVCEPARRIAPLGSL